MRISFAIKNRNIYYKHHKISKKRLNFYDIIFSELFKISFGRATEDLFKIKVILLWAFEAAHKAYLVYAVLPEIFDRLDDARIIEIGGEAHIKALFKKDGKVVL